MFGLGMQELMVVAVVALLLFGKRLPEVARTAGKYYTEFRRHLNDLQSQMNITDVYHSNSSSSKNSVYSSYTPPTSSYEGQDDYDAATAPKFEPPPAAPAAPPAAPAAASAEPGPEKK